MATSWQANKGSALIHTEEGVDAISNILQVNMTVIETRPIQLQIQQWSF